jgi:predicted nuclease with TOPRIM domain
MRSIEVIKSLSSDLYNELKKLQINIFKEIMKDQIQKIGNDDFTDFPILTILQDYSDLKTFNNNVKERLEEMGDNYKEIYNHTNQILRDLKEMDDEKICVETSKLLYQYKQNVKNHQRFYESDDLYDVIKNEIDKCL